MARQRIAAEIVKLEGELFFLMSQPVGSANIEKLEKQIAKLREKYAKTPWWAE